MYLSKIIRPKEFTYKCVLWLAIACGVITGLLLDVELLKIEAIKDNSFFNMGICFEFWVFVTMIIVSRTQKPLEAACKVFLFFLISQPLIYLVKVPFDSRGWGVFVDYKGWFIWTLLTFPGAFVAWFTNKKNNLGIVIFMVAILFLSYEFAQHFATLITNFPFQIIACAFILFQMVCYVMSFNGRRRIVFGALTALSVIAITILFVVEF